MKSESPPIDGNRRYVVFLSYRHSDNKQPGRQWGTWLHQMLESYDISPDLVGTTNRSGEVIPASLYPVFRDEEELPADADLTRNIRLALENSALLVVICSPRAVQSRFVAEEIRYFKELGKADRILALMVDGEPNAADDPAKQAAGFTAEMECLPEPLRRGVIANDGRVDWDARTEPVAADARPGGRPVQGWTNGAAYREQLLRAGVIEKSKVDSEVQSYEKRLELAKLKIVAGALGVPLGVLTQRDKAMQLERARKRAQALRRWLAVVGLFAVFSVGGGMLAWKKQREATLERDAKEQARVEEAKQRKLAQDQSEQRRRLLVEAARSDRLQAAERLTRRESPAAFAYLARSLLYDSASIAAAGEAVSALNVWVYPVPIAICSHHDQVTTAQFSPDGHRIVTASHDKTAQIWEAQSGKSIAALQGHADEVWSAQWSPNGQLIVTASRDKTARVWEARGGKLLAILNGHSGSVRSARFSPDGQRVVTASDDKSARIWDAQSGKLLATLIAHQQKVNDAEFSADSKRIVTVSNDKTVRVWEAQSGTLLFTLQGHQRLIFSGQFSPDSQHIVTASSDTTARVWEVQGGKLLATLQGHQGAVRSAWFSSDGQRVVTASDDKTARVWDAQSGRLLASLEGHRDDVISAQFSPDGKRIVTASADATAQVWDAESGKLLSILQGHRGSIHYAQFSPDGQHVATAGDQTGRVWQAESGKLLMTLRGQKALVGSLQFSPDGNRIVTTSTDLKTRTWHFAQVWEIPSGKLVSTLEGSSGEINNKINSAQFSPDGQRIVTASWDKTAQIWGAETGKLFLTLKGHKSVVFSAQFAPDGRRVVTGSADGAARVWDAQNGKLLASLEGHGKPVRCAQFSPDGQRIVTGSSDRTARVWEVKNSKCLVSLEGHSGEVTSVQFSPDGRRVVTASDDRTARVWEAEGGKLVTTLRHQSPVISAQFCSDGQGIVTACLDKTARVWAAQSGELVGTLRTDLEMVAAAPFNSEERHFVSTSRNETTGVTTFSGDTGEIITAQFGSDCQHVDMASREGAVSQWTILPLGSGSPPPWFPDFLHYMAQLRLNSEGELEPIPPADWFGLRDRLRQTIRDAAGHDTPYLSILRHFVYE